MKSGGNAAFSFESEVVIRGEIPSISSFFGISFSMRKALFPLFLFSLLFLLLLDPSRYFLSVKGGLLLFLSSVLPSMLPYFFFTKLLTATGCVSALSASFGRPVGKVYGVAPIASYPLLMSLLSGYPVGACVLSDLYEKGLLSREDALRAASFTSTI